MSGWDCSERVWQNLAIVCQTPTSFLNLSRRMSSTRKATWWLLCLQANGVNNLQDLMFSLLGQVSGGYISYVVNQRPQP